LRPGQTHNQPDIESFGYGKGYLAALDTWRSFLDGVNALRDERGMGVILIAHAEIKRFDSPGQVHVSDSEQLHFKPLIVTLKVEPAGNDKYGVYREARSKVAGYSAANAGSAAGTTPRPANPGTRPAAAAPPPAARPGAAATPPWRRNA
jgi:hypothetical protein